MAKWRAHWSLKLGVACYLVSLHVNKKITAGPSFFLWRRRWYIVDCVDVMAELEDLIDESIRKGRRTKACGR